MVLHKKGKYAIIFAYKLHEFIGQSEHHHYSMTTQGGGTCM